MNKILAIAAISMALGTVTPASTFAQSPPQDRPMMGMMGGGCPMMGMMGQGMMNRGQMGSGMFRGRRMGPARMGAMAEGRLAYLKAELKISDAQKAAWKEYADAVKARVAVMQTMRQSMMETMQKGNASKRMETRITGMEAMVEAMKAVKPAIDKLYAVLADEQKKVADQLIGAGCGAM